MMKTGLDTTDLPPPTAGPVTMIAPTTEIDRRDTGRQAGRTGDAVVPARRGWNRVLAKTARAAISRHPRRLAPAVTNGAPNGPRPQAGGMMAAVLVMNRRTDEAQRTAALIHMPLIHIAITGRHSTLILTIGRTAEAIDPTGIDLTGITATLARRQRGTLLIVRTATPTERRIDTHLMGSRRTTITGAAITIATASMPARRRTDDRRTKAMPTIMADHIAVQVIGGLRVVTPTMINRDSRNHRRSGFPA